MTEAVPQGNLEATSGGHILSFFAAAYHSVRIGVLHYFEGYTTSFAMESIV